MVHKVVEPGQPEYSRIGCVTWRDDDGNYHREEGPAVVSSDRSQEWFFDDRRHRIDGPAVEYANGYKEWWVNGNLHREDGPAVVSADGRKEWFINNERQEGPPASIQGIISPTSD